MRKAITIFCVDDEKYNRLILNEILSEYDCVLLDSGKACYNELEQQIPDLILMDVMMPEMDGLEACRKIRDLPECHDIPIIFLSGNSSLEAKLNGYSAGGDDFISKPFEEEELVAKIKASIKRKARIDEIRSEIASVKSSSNELTDTLGEMGAVIYFLQSILSAKNYEALAKKVIEAHESLGLDIAIEFMHDGERFNYSSDNIANPLEASAFEFVRDKGRLHDFGERTAVNYPAVSIIVRNMPISNPELHGRIRDHIAIIAQGTNNKIEELGTAFEILNKYQKLVEGITSAEHALIDLDYALKENNKSDDDSNLSVQVNTILAEVNEVLAGSSLDDLIDNEEEEAAEAVVFF